MSNVFLASAAAGSIMPSRELVGDKVHPSMGVRFDAPGCPLEAKALVMTLGKRSVVLLALDLCYASDTHVGPLRQALAKATGLNVTDVVVSCTHSHSTPQFEPLTGAHPYFEFVLATSVRITPRRGHLAGRHGWATQLHMSSVRHSTSVSRWRTGGQSSHATIAKVLPQAVR